MIQHGASLTTDRPRHLADHDIKEIMSCARPETSELLGPIRLNASSQITIDGDALTALGRVTHIWAIMQGPRSIFFYIECDPTLLAGEPLKFRAFGNNPNVRRIASAHHAIREFNLYRPPNRATSYFAVLA